MLTRVRVLGAPRNFSPRVNFQCRLSYGVRTVPVCNRMHQHLRGRKTNPSTLAAIIIVWTHEITADTGRNGRNGQRCSCMLLYLTKLRRPEFPARDNEVLNNNNYKTKHTQKQNKTNKQTKTKQNKNARVPCFNTERRFVPRKYRLVSESL